MQDQNQRPIRSLMKRTKEFITKLTLLKDEAGRLGLFATMQALDPAIKKVGYEVADLKMKKGKKK